MLLEPVQSFFVVGSIVIALAVVGKRSGNSVDIIPVPLFGNVLVGFDRTEQHSTVLLAVYIPEHADFMCLRFVIFTDLRKLIVHHT